MFLFFCVEVKICFEQMRNKRSSARSWNNMDYDILVKIFMLLNVMVWFLVFLECGFLL